MTYIYVKERKRLLCCNISCLCHIKASCPNDLRVSASFVVDALIRKCDTENRYIEMHFNLTQIIKIMDRHVRSVGLL